VVLAPENRYLVVDPSVGTVSVITDEGAAVNERAAPSQASVVGVTLAPERVTVA
jgi:hypothetical protein